MQIYADFDGTIAIPDVTDLVLQCCAAPEWETIEADWLAGTLSAAECMRRQIAMIDADAEALNAVLDSVDIDPDFAAFARWCETEGLQLAIVSDGVDVFIRRILERHELGSIPLFANALSSDGARHTLAQPWMNTSCAAQQGVCKCEVTSATSGPLIFVGDGRSDQCVSQIADLVFAKGGLADFCVRSHRKFVPYSTFADVQRELRAVLARTSFTTPLKNAPAPAASRERT